MASKRTKIRDEPLVVLKDDIGEGITNEEEVLAGMRRNAMEFHGHDTDHTRKLDFKEFCSLVREREVTEYTEPQLRDLFHALDEDKSGKVDVNEYIKFALRDALARSAARVLDLMRKWDDDDSGKIERKEFRRALRALGFAATTKELDGLFDGEKSSALPIRAQPVPIPRSHGAWQLDARKRIG